MKGLNFGIKVNEWNTQMPREEPTHRRLSRAHKPADGDGTGHDLLFRHDAPSHDSRRDEDQQLVSLAVHR